MTRVCGGCAHHIRGFITVDYRIGEIYCNTCALDYDAWTDEEVEAMERGECPYFMSREVL